MFSAITLFSVLLVSFFNTSALFSISSSLLEFYNSVLTTSTFSLPDLLYSFESQISTFNLISTYLDNIEYYFYEQDSEYFHPHVV